VVSNRTSLYLGQVSAEVTCKIGTFEIVRQSLECLRALALRTVAFLGDYCLSTYPEPVLKLAFPSPPILYESL
jgi:hypothetical protein